MKKYRGIDKNQNKCYGCFLYRFQKIEIYQLKLVKSRSKRKTGKFHFVCNFKRNYDFCILCTTFDTIQILAFYLLLLLYRSCSKMTSHRFFNLLSIEFSINSWNRRRSSVQPSIVEQTIKYSQPSISFSFLLNISSFSPILEGHIKDLFYLSDISPDLISHFHFDKTDGHDNNHLFFYSISTTHPLRPHSHNFFSRKCQSPAVSLKIQIRMQVIM